MKKKCAACLLLVASGAWAQSGEPSGAASARVGGLRAHLAVEGGVDCVDRAALAAGVKARLTQSSLVDADAAEVLVEVTIEPAGPATAPSVAHVRMHTPAGRELGRRELEAPAAGCASLESALVFVLALAIESPALREAVQEAPPPPPPAPAQSASVPAPVAPPWEPPAPPPRTTRPRTELELGGHGATLLAALPEPAVGFGLYLGLGAPRRWPLRGELTAYLPQRTYDRALPEPRPGATVFWADLTAFACPAIVGKAHWDLALCAGGSAGLLASQGRNLDRARTVRELDVALTTRLLLTRDLGPLSVGAGVGGGAWLRRHDLVYSDRTEQPVVLYERPPGFGSFVLTVGRRIPGRRAAEGELGSE